MSASNYPAGVTDRHPHFAGPESCDECGEDVGEGEECEGCGTYCMTADDRADEAADAAYDMAREEGY